LETGETAKNAISQLGIKAVDVGALEEIVRRVIAANPKAVAEYKKGKTAAAQSFMGAVMRETKGAAKADVVQKLIAEELQKL
jgi:aspartyl-tRNA(Asn)/glutamyl-tRNA(Gln) amidotransferase subunit B